MIKQAIAVPAGKDGHYAPWQFTALAGLLEARDTAGGRPALDFDKPFVWVWPAARRAIADAQADAAERSAAAALLGYRARRDAEDRDLLLGLLRPQVSADLQQAAVAALGKTTDPKLPDLLVHDWRSHSPQVRSAILDTLLSRTAWTSSLLSSLEDGCVPPGEIDPGPAAAASGAAQHVACGLARRPSSPTRPRPRQAVVDSFRSALTIKGDRAAGARRIQESSAPHAIAWETKVSRSGPISRPSPTSRPSRS